MEQVKRALISVSDKTGVIEFASRLSKLGYEIISTGGTYTVLTDAGLSVLPAEKVTGFPECFGGRVKTIHPHILGGILFRRDQDADQKEARQLGIKPIDLVAVNLYPFAETLKKISARAEAGLSPELIEQIDIGGPTLLRSAAKNYQSVTVLSDPSDYKLVLEELEKSGHTTPELRQTLASKAFLLTAAYDALIAETFAGGHNHSVILNNHQTLRYGENPHQTGSYFDFYGTSRSWEILQENKKVSYLNLLDADSAWQAVSEFSEPTVAMVKHANPSGMASHKNIAEAFQRAYDADRLSAFGVIIALNRPCDSEIIRKIIDQNVFVEIIIAPDFDQAALSLLKKKGKIRAIKKSPPSHPRQLFYKSALDGVLVQSADDRPISLSDLQVVTKNKPTSAQLNDLLFAWRVVKHAKSNAIVFAKDSTTVGLGCGQTSRVDAVWIAAKRAGEKANGAVMASDAFFPFPDSVSEAAAHGISAIIQPGGSVRDNDVIAKADELGLAMVLTGYRVFKH